MVGREGKFGWEKGEVECYWRAGNGVVVSFVTGNWSVGDAIPDEEMFRSCTNTAKLPLRLTYDDVFEAFRTGKASACARL